LKAAASIDHVASSTFNGPSSLMDVVGVLLIAFGAVTVLYAAGWVFVILGKRSLHTRKGPAEASPPHSADNRQIGD
jgi:hypothetical protein